LLPKKVDSSRPILPSVKHAYHVKSIFPDLINNDIRQGWHYPLSRSCLFSGTARVWKNVLARAERRRSRVTIARRWLEFSQRDNSRYSADHLRPPESSERVRRCFWVMRLSMHATTCSCSRLRGDRLVPAGFTLANEPFVVTHQTLDRLMHQRFAVASLLRGNAVKLSLQFW
jgi:hypothetical protein